MAGFDRIEINLFINQKIYYEVTFTAANANTSKFDRVIAFTQYKITDNYAKAYYDKIILSWAWHKGA